MTLIVGLTYKEGVVLIGDTKIMDGNNDSHHDTKIVAPLEGAKIAVGSAGFTQLAKEFNIKIKLQVPMRIAEYRLMNMKALEGTGMDIRDIEDGTVTDVKLPFEYHDNYFLDECATLTKQIADTGRVYGNNPIESLVALFDNVKGYLY